MNVDRTQSRGEEIANSLTHGAALLASAVALPVLLRAAWRTQDGWQIVASATFGASLLLLYAASTLYHAISAQRAKRVLRVVDHAAIYLLIAGTYTPFTLGPLRGPVGWWLFGGVWTLAALGIASKCIFRFRFPRLSTVLYLGMGWLVVLAARPLLAHVPLAGLAWLLAGGLCYTSGVGFYGTDGRLKFGHAAWHLFVVAGSACHVVAVLGYAWGPAA